MATAKSPAQPGMSHAESPEPIAETVSASHSQEKAAANLETASRPLGSASNNGNGDEKKTSRVDRSDRAERPDRSERNERHTRGERNDRPERPLRTERSTPGIASGAAKKQETKKEEAVKEEKRYFTLPEAKLSLQSLLPQLQTVVQLRMQLRTLYVRLEDAGFPPTPKKKHSTNTNSSIVRVVSASRSSKVPPEVQRDTVVFYALFDTLKEKVDEMQESGCQIKDLEQGLIDWPCMHNGREVMLCWQLGETEISHFHELEDGFAGRKPIAEL